MDQAERYKAFAALHQPGAPVVLFNIWDAGSARAVVAGGARAVATGSASVAGASGCADGEALPMDWALDNARRIVAAVDVPVTLDFEGGYAVDPADLSQNAAALVATGVVGLNFEDQIIGGTGLNDTGLHDTGTQSRRIAALRAGAGASLWINARTDVFLKVAPEDRDASVVEAALVRAEAYAKAGGDSLFVPGLKDLDLIRSLCARAPLPVNIMMYPDMASRADLADCGVARISYGPFPWLDAMAAVTKAAQAAMA